MVPAEGNSGNISIDKEDTGEESWDTAMQFEKDANLPKITSFFNNLIPRPKEKGENSIVEVQSAKVKDVQRSADDEQIPVF